MKKFANSIEWSDDATILQVKPNVNKYFSYYYNKNDNSYYIFIGKLIDSVNDNGSEKSKFNLIGKVKHTYFAQLEIKDNDNSDIKIYEGELVCFEKTINIKYDVFVPLAESILLNIRSNHYMNLEGAIQSLIAFLEKYSSDDELNRLQGYISEMLFVKKISDIDLELAKKLIKYYQYNDNNTHDFSVNQKFKIEIKSTRSDKLKFIIKDEQKSNIVGDSNLLYVFIKINKREKDWIGSKNLSQLVSFLYEKLEIEATKIAPHLDFLVFTKKWEHFYFDVEDYEIYYLNSKDLPDFQEYKDKYAISNLVYEIYMSNYSRKNNYVNDEAEQMMLNYLREEILNGK